MEWMKLMALGDPPGLGVPIGEPTVPNRNDNDIRPLRVEATK